MRKEANMSCCLRAVCVCRRVRARACFAFARSEFATILLKLLEATCSDNICPVEA